MKRNLAIYIMLLAFLGCKKPYKPDVVENNVNLLVVEGSINTGIGGTTIRLSRTTNLQGREPKPEIGAIVIIETENNQTYQMYEVSRGHYIYNGNMPTAGTRYRLRITTLAGAVYLSELVQPRITPPIDDVLAEIKPNGLQISLNSHDDTNNSRYYRFEYEETWQFYSRYMSRLMVKDGKLVNRPDADDIYRCFGNYTSNAINIASTARLAQNVLSMVPIVLVPSADEKLSVKYSILVTQYAISEADYKYWETLKKNTENVGSIFDPQPTFVSGNIYCVTNPDEKVLGYVGAGTFTQKRIFVDKSELPESWGSKYPYECPVDTIAPADQAVFFNNPKLVPIVAEYSPFNELLFYLGADMNCVDCRTRGTKVKPLFWP